MRWFGDRDASMCELRVFAQDPLDFVDSIQVFIQFSMSGWEKVLAQGPMLMGAFDGHDAIGAAKF